MTAPIKEKHLDLLQGVINRMAGNSFLLRGWSVTLVSALLTLGANHAQPLVVAIALLPVFTFWGLDGYFLAQERLFRDLYAKVIDPHQSVPDYSLSIAPCTFSLWFRAVRRPLLLVLHGAVLTVTVCVLAYLWSGGALAPAPR